MRSQYKARGAIPRLAASIAVVLDDRPQAGYTPQSSRPTPRPLATSPDSRFVIVPRRPRTRLLAALMLVLWLATLWLAVYLTREVVAPDLDTTRSSLAGLERDHAEALATIDRLRDRNTVLKRSDQVSRAANQELQELLADREEEVSQLRADLAFYERLVGAGSQRQGLAVHSLALDPGDSGDGTWHYTLTLTQNLKKAKVSTGDISLRIDGVRAGKLSTLQWGELLQSEEAEPQAFAFKYFQQLEGSLMLPSDFTPHRVWVRVKTDGRAVEQSFAWQATQQTQGA